MPLRRKRQPNYAMPCDGPASCSGRGTCDLTRGVCECPLSFTGAHCEVATLPACVLGDHLIPIRAWVLLPITLAMFLVGALRHHAESRARLARHCPPEAPHAKPGEEIEVRRPNGEFESFDAARGRARARERRGEATRAKTDDRASGRADEGRETVLRGGASGGETVAGRGGGVERGARGEREDEKGGKGTEASNGDRGG